MPAPRVLIRRSTRPTQPKVPKGLKTVELRPLPVTSCACPANGLSIRCHKPEHKFQALLMHHAGSNPETWGERSGIACAKFKFEHQ